MTDNVFEGGANSHRGDESEAVLLPLVEEQWEALRRGASLDTESWVKRHPEGTKGLADMRVLNALHDAVSSLAEDSRTDVSGDSEPSSRDDASSPIESITTDWDTPPRGADLEFTEGQSLGKYTIKEILGRGGQATTYKAWDPDLQRHVVVKLYRTAGLERDAVIREGQKLTKVRSPYVVQCFTVERYQNAPYLVLEFISGDSLTNLHKAKPFTVRQALDITARVADGLDAVHARGILHGDVKPSNILLRDDGVPHLVDFGLSKPLGDESLATASGTPAFMAPEQARGDLDRIDARSDIFGLGATLYFLLTGSAPYQENSVLNAFEAARRGDIVPPRARNRRVPRDVNNLCMRCLAKAPEGRFNSARELSTFIRRRRWRRYGPLAVVAALLMLIAGYSLNAYFRPSTLQSSSETTRVNELELLIRRNGDDQRIFGQRLVVDGVNQLGDADTLGANDDFKISGRLNRAAHWGLFWLDTAGVVELVAYSDARDETVDYPRGNNFMTVNANDPKGVHLLILVTSDAPLNNDPTRVAGPLATLTPPLLAQVAGLRGPGGARKTSVTLPETFLREVETRLPDGVKAVRVIPLVTEG